MASFDWQYVKLNGALTALDDLCQAAKSRDIAITAALAARALGEHAVSAVSQLRATDSHNNLADVLERTSTRAMARAAAVLDRRY